MPCVSIIIPCYNSGKYIRETVASIEQQTFKDYEIIIIDDGSDDEATLQSLKELEKHDKLTILHQQNSGPAIARNFGIDKAQGDYIVFLDADDIIREDTLNICIKKFEERNETDVVYGNCMWFGEKDGLKKQSDFNIVRMLRSNDTALCSMIKKDSFIRAGGFDENLSMKGIEDWDLWLSMAEQNMNFVYVDELLFNIRVSSGSRTFEVANKNLDETVEYIYKKHSVLMSKAFLELYHENKNLKNTIDFKIGQTLLAPM